jgi:hypothetical protein
MKLIEILAESNELHEGPKWDKVKSFGAGAANAAAGAASNLAAIPTAAVGGAMRGFKRGLTGQSFSSPDKSNYNRDYKYNNSSDSEYNAPLQQKQKRQQNDPNANVETPPNTQTQQSDANVIAPAITQTQPEVNAQPSRNQMKQLQTQISGLTDSGKVSLLRYLRQEIAKDNLSPIKQKKQPAATNINTPVTNPTTQPKVTKPKQTTVANPTQTIAPKQRKPKVPKASS